MKGFIFLVIMVFPLFPLMVMGQGENSFEKPNQLPTSINSVAEESTPILTPDGNTIYFSRIFYPENIGGEYAGADIWVSRKNEIGEWQEAVNLGKPINNNKNNFVIGISQDGKRLYMVNSYKSTKNNAIAVSKKFMGEWEDPEPVPVKLPKYDGPVGFYMHPSEKILLISMNAEDSYGKEDLYVSLKNDFGEWSEPENLGRTINTEGYEISPFLGQDGNTLYFASNGHKGKGSADIFRAERKYGSWNVWDKLKNLDQINGKGFDAYLVKNKDYYFMSNNG
ncbi:MAG: hypothetical protein ACNS62_05880, partial [Candidatus Cyclobacteriaceae bacterium M3_2C_046]